MRRSVAVSSGVHCRVSGWRGMRDRTLPEPALRVPSLSAQRGPHVRSIGSRGTAGAPAPDCGQPEGCLRLEDGLVAEGCQRHFAELVWISLAGLSGGDDARSNDVTDDLRLTPIMERPTCLFVSRCENFDRLRIELGLLERVPAFDHCTPPPEYKSEATYGPSVN